MKKLRGYQSTDLSDSLFDTDTAKQKVFEFNRIVLEGMNRNSRKSLEAGIKQYLNFCQKESLVPFSKSLNISRDTIHKYIEYMVVKGYAQATLKNRLAAISRIFRIIEIRNPLQESEIIKEYVKQSLIKLQPAKQVTPIRHKELKSLTQLSNESTLVDIRNALVLYLGIYTLCRASELLAIEISDIDLHQKTVFIRRAKNDQFGVGRYANISEKTASIIQLYLDKTNLTEGRLIRAISRGGNIQTTTYQYGSKKGQARDVMSYEGLLHIIKKISTVILNEDQLNGTIGSHSLRVGSAVSMAEQGVEITQIAQAGGWKNLKMVLLYTRQANTKTTGTAHFID